ncbi:hypothetical protein BDW59DRAFT_141906 [Aspergillus cavernicola]|uniref:Glutathione S-transferase UstS-like C-terminal domain-containing protein n=1 Tax=Aspergillus cavernicola TaxID=176166 RepID=A0ABR4IS90_9EURO
MTDSTPVHFFDILSDLPGPSKAWSPNTLKTRMTLNYKAIPYTQTYITYPDIAPLLISLSIPPHPKGAAHTPYTLPVICHPSVTSTPSGALMNSFPIALHLEEQYPARTIFPSGNASYALAVAVDKLMQDATMAGYTLLAPPIAEILDKPRGREFYIRTRSSGDMFGKPLGEVRPTDEEEVEGLVREMKRGMMPLLQMLKGKSGGKSGPYFEGDQPGYADFICVAYLFWVKVADGKIWEELMGLGDGEVKALWYACYQWVEGQGEEKDWEIRQ